MDTNFIKYNSKEEAIAAFRKMKQRKKEWLEQTDRELKLIRVTLTDFTLHFSCCFTNLLHSHFVSLLNNFTMQEKCY